jgi:hypothetical protein
MPGTRHTPSRVAFLMEQTLGHVTYTRNLQAADLSGFGITPTWLRVAYDRAAGLDRLPKIGSNWALRGSRRAWSAWRASGGARTFDAAFLHTQTIALLAPLIARRAPVVISLDATPANFDSIGAFYGHDARPGSALESAKTAIYRRVFRSATALTTWSQWAKDSLAADYGVKPEQVTVARPGINLALFPFGRMPHRDEHQGPLRILFVGGDFERKGGPLLLDCMEGELAQRCQLHLVTKAPVTPRSGVYVYNDIGPNDARLLELYRDADIFVLPTLADCLGVVIGEAMAAGLPMVTTTVGALPEVVQDGTSGILVSPNDKAGLATALLRLAREPELRRRMGQAGRTLAERSFDTRVTAEQIAAAITAGIERWHGERRRQHRAA